MKEKVIKILNDRIDNVGENNIFEGFISRFNVDYYKVNPISQSKLIIESRNTYGLKDHVYKYQVYELLNFTIRFEDGQPDFVVSTKTSSNSTHCYPTILKKRLFRKNIVQHNEFYENHLKTIISVGHKTFELTKRERIQLTDKCKEAYANYLILKEKKEDRELEEKLDLRIKNKS